ncbi:MAG: ATP-binding protein [Chloroflexota bacterium]
MQSLLSRFRQVKRRGILVESLLFVGLYVAALLLLAPDAPARPLVENLAVLASSLTGSLLNFFSLPGLASAARPAWLLLALALLAWLAADFAKTFYLFLPGSEQPFFSLVDVLNLSAYLFAALALLGYPSESRYAPTRFRFILDAVISSGVVVTLGWFLLARPALGSSLSRLTILALAAYPLADLVLLMVLSNVSLTSLMPRATAAFLGAGLAAFAFSDYAYSSLALLGAARSGTLISLGWVCGALLMGLGAVFERARGEPAPVSAWEQPGLGVQVQKVLPLALVLVLFWYVLADWRLRGAFSPFGVWMSLALGIMLVVRLGIRAGEVELQRYWQLFKNLADPAFICDLNGKVVLGNPAFEQLRVLPEAGQSLPAVFAGLPSGGLRSLLGGKQGSDVKIEVTLQGARTPYLLSLSRVAAEGRRDLAAGVAYNLSEQKRQRDAIQSAYDELQALHKQLEELNASLEQIVEQRTANLQEAYRRLEDQNRALQALDRLKSDFVSMVSHELRNPLNNLGGGLELLVERRRGRGGDKNTLALMQAEVRRLTRFVENILNVSAIEAGRLVLRCAPLSLESTLERVVKNLGPQDKDGRLQALLPPGLPRVLAEQGALESVLGHLLDNALKYAPDGQVQVSAEKRGRRVRIAVRDFGPGIPDEKRDLLFERFQRLDAKDSQAVYGYGLGLYLSKRLLQAMGSDLAFDPPPDGGACFSFSLKAAAR